MHSWKISAALLVAALCVSGLGMSWAQQDEAMPAVSPITDAPEGSVPISDVAGAPSITYGTIPDWEPKSVARTVFAEDYTEWGCGPCASHNPAWNAAITALGYDTVAPAFVHVWWPAGTDPIYYYSNVDGSVQDRCALYGITYVPWPINDGTYIDYGQTQAYYESAFTTRAAVPSPIIISTAGSLVDDPSDSGTMNLRITASDTITSTNLRVFVYLWEDDINRALWNPVSSVWDSPPYPNGETVLKWAVWDIIPNGDGTAIWPSGATAGSYVDLSYPLTLDSTWVFANIGATVFVQDLTTHEVFQSKVETFDNVPPAVSLNTPAPATSEQVLSGTIPITWTATDVEDAQATIDISIDYSADGGATWNSIMSGTDNNISPYTYNWNTVSAGIPDGIGYKLRVKATDSLGNYRYATSAEAFSVMNTPDDEWFFQVETTGTYKDLTVKPVENTANTVASTSINAAGEYKIGTWQTVQTFTGMTINGPWNFKTYGKTPNPGMVTLQGQLYAKVFTSGNMGSPLDTTVYDDENVGTYTASHLFTWTDSLAGLISNGDSVVIEVWLHVTGGPYTQASGSTTNSGFDTVLTPWTYTDWEDAGPGTAGGSWVGSGGNPGGMAEIVLVSESTGPGTTAYPYSGFFQQSFTSSFAPFTATLELDWKVTQANAVDPMTMYFNAYVETASGIPTTAPVWGVEVQASAPTAWVSVDVDITSKVPAAGTYYVKIMFRHDSLQKGDGTYAGGYDNVLLSFARPYSIYYMEYDFGTTQSSVVPSILVSGGNIAPLADAGADQSGTATYLANFNGANSFDSDGTIVSYSWAFTYNSSPQTLTGVSPSFSFAIPGTYVVTLTVTDDDGATDTDTMTVTVNSPPTANAGTDQTGTVDYEATFNGAGSSDPDGSIVSYSWTFTYNAAPQTLTGVSPTFNFQIPGVYTVTLTVTDDDGATDTDTMTVTVSYLTHNIALAAGWNLISFAVNTEGGKPLATVFADEWANIQAIRYYDTASGSWKMYDKNAPAWMNSLKTADESKGYWVKAASASTLTVTGKALTTTTIPLSAGWNLVGVPDNANVVANTALAGTGFDLLMKYSVAQTYLIATMAGTENMVPGSAYWVHVPAATSYVVTY